MSAGKCGFVARYFWQYSSFHNYVQQGIYDVMWGGSEKLIFNSFIGME